MSANESPAKKDWHAAKVPGCTCERCAQRYGDQAEDFGITAAQFEREVRLREDIDDDALNTIRAKEREACAKAVESRCWMADFTKQDIAREIAAAIRARGGA